MFYIIEDSKQLYKFYSRGYENVFMEIISNSPFIHPSRADISLIYLRPLNAHKGYFLCLKHNETLSLDKEDVDDLISSFTNIYTLDKKQLLYFYPLKNIHDISLNIPTYNKPNSIVYSRYYNKHKHHTEINEIIPISKHYEFYTQVYEDIKQCCYTPVSSIFSHKAPIVFNAIEKSGLKIDTQLFEDYFETPNQDVIFTRYQYNTLTTRPSNKFNSINFMALNKKDGSKKCFIPQNSRFIEIDISAYHPTMVGQIIGYDFENKDIHQEFADMYGVSYAESKPITFKMFYGGDFGEYKDLPFFIQMKEFVDKMWEEFNTKGQIQEEIGKYIFYKDKLEKLNPFKLFNYYLQARETAQNIHIMWDILKILKNHKTKLVLYVYDSFTFDFDDKEKYLLDEILPVFECRGLNVKLKSNKTLDFE